MTTIAILRQRYATLMHATDPRPSRFADPLAYRDWSERAAAWAEFTGQSA